MLLFHACAVLATMALAERGLVHARIGLVAAIGFVVAAGLFAGDLTLRQYAGHGTHLAMVSEVLQSMINLPPSEVAPGSDQQSDPRL
ncbi:hypothetical protein ES703_122794 [subsurface metagenome]